MKHCEIMTRIKNNYENRSKSYLTRRTPVIIRLDGKAFHTYTKGLDKPFDEGLIQDMQLTAIYLCQNIQGVKCAYTQSDEISLLLTDCDTLTTDAWFDYNIQKICSVSASLATGYFNWIKEDDSAKLAFFDSRCFNIPKEEVNNYFVARQKDAVKNSISMLAQSLYSHSELHKKNGSDMQEMCFQKGHNWNDLHFSKKRGSFIVKNTYYNDKFPIDKETYELGEIWYKSETNQLLEMQPDPLFGKIFVQIPIEKVRTKWEVIETPEFSSNKDIIDGML